MNSRITICLLLILACAGISVPEAEAGWHEFVHRSMLDWHRNNAWPQPFIQMDRIATCSPFVIQRQNGLCSEFTIGDYHFNQDSQTLTEAGRNKVYDIIRRQPNGFNQVFVVRGRTEQTSAIRLDAVQQTLAKYITDGSLPDVRFTTTAPRGQPAAYVDAIGRKAAGSVPDPRLPAFTSTSN